MSDTPSDRPASTNPANEQDPPPAETDSDPPSVSPVEPEVTAETENDAVSSTSPQAVDAMEGAEGQVPDGEPAGLSGINRADTPGEGQEAHAVQEAPAAPGADAEPAPEPAAFGAVIPEPASPEPASPEPASAEPASPEPAASEPASSEPATPEPASPEPAAGGAPVPQEPAGPTDAPRPVFDPAPPPPRGDAPAEATATAAPDVPATPSPPGPGPVPASAAGERTPEPQLDQGVEPPSPTKSPLARRWPLLLIPLVVVAVVVAAFAVKSNTDKAVDKVKTTTAAFVTFTDKEKGFSIKYPAKWKRVGRPNEELRLLVKDEGLDSLLVRVVPTPAPFPADLTGEEAKQVADVVLKRETFAPERILREQPVNVNGAPGYYYLYTFDEEIKGQGPPQKVQGVHAHYIVFSGRRVFILVFQALPTSNFDKLAATFDAMAESFTITPLASDAPDPTTAQDPAAPAPAPAPTDTSAPAPAGR